MPLLGGDLGVRPGADLAERQVVDLDGDTVPVAPRPGDLAIEPLVVSGNEMGPLGNAQHGSRGVSPAGGGEDAERGPSRGGGRAGEEFAPARTWGRRHGRC